LSYIAGNIKFGPCLDRNYFQNRKQLGKKVGTAGNVILLYPQYVVWLGNISQSHTSYCIAVTGLKMDDNCRLSFSTLAWGHSPAKKDT